MNKLINAYIQKLNQRINEYNKDTKESQIKDNKWINKVFKKELDNVILEQDRILSIKQKIDIRIEKMIKVKEKHNANIIDTHYGLIFYYSKEVKIMVIDKHVSTTKYGLWDIPNMFF